MSRGGLLVLRLQGKDSRYRCYSEAELHSHLEGAWEQAWMELKGRWMQLVDAKWVKSSGPCECHSGSG